mgnify:CR=1 FL=1
MFKGFHLLLVALVLSLNASSLPVIINGKSAAGDAFVFRLYSQLDPISGAEKLVDQQRPDKNGDFMLGFEANEIQQVSIHVGLQSIVLLVKPGETYRLNFNEITLKDQNVFLPQSPLRVLFEKEDLLNMVKDGFDYENQKFLESQFIKLIKYRDKRIYDRFEEEVDKMFSETPFADSSEKEFLKSYIDYRLAELRLTSRIESREKTGIEMLTSEALQFHIPSYGQFFLKYFDQFFIEFQEGREYAHFKALLKKENSYSELMDVLGKDEVLVKEKLRETVLILALKQVFFKVDFNKHEINTLLEYIANNSKYESNRQIAYQVYNDLNTFLPGNSVPDFELKNLKGTNRKLSDFMGAKTYLMFVSPNCETCEADIRILKSVKETLGENFNILTVLAGFDSEESEEWAVNQKANWDFLWFDNDFALLNQYKVKTFPKYLLLDEKGQLLKYFPPKPRENLLGYLQNLEKKEKPVEQESSDFFRKN